MSRRNSNSFDVEAIKAANPLEAVLSARGVILKRQGAALRGKCPFHHEVNGTALSVWPEGRWHCFGKCGAGGDVIEAVMRLDGCDFKTACERLAGGAGVRIPAPVPLAPGQIAASQRRKREAEKNRQRESALNREARMTLPVILRDFAWSEADVWEASPIRIEGPPAEDAAHFLETMFMSDAVLWIGGLADSGKPRHSAHFRPVREWLAAGDMRGPHICPAIFKAGIFSRSEANIQSRPYLVLEGDATDPVCAHKMTKKQPLNDADKARNRAACLAVINWLRLMTDLRLRSIVDAGNKSAHGWFDLPDAATLDEMRVVLPALGFDRATLLPPQPVRLPGVRRAETGRWQRLLYLNPCRGTPT